MTWLEIVGVIALILLALRLGCDGLDYAEWFRDSYRFFRVYGNGRIEAAGKALAYVWSDESAPLSLHGKETRAARAAALAEEQTRAA